MECQKVEMKERYLELPKEFVKVNLKEKSLVASKASSTDLYLEMPMARGWAN